ncbi:MAG: glycosyltransferase [Deltaproteobacteria bacterium]
MIMQVIIWILALYGLIEIIIEAYRAVFVLNNVKDMYILIAVKNQEENIEGVVRSIVFKNLYNRNDEIFNNIIIADMGSTDNTVKILEKLCSEYECLKVIDCSEANDAIRKIFKDNNLLQIK